jgi:hypothetical protein
MRTILRTLLLTFLLVTGVAAPVHADNPPTVTFTLLTPLPEQLAVGETAVIGVRVESSEPFLMAIALSDAYYPGRGVRFDGSAAVPNATSADLYLTITATASTADLPAVDDWPADEDWAPGELPLIVRVGARFPGGVVIGESFLFGLTVT